MRNAATKNNYNRDRMRTGGQSLQPLLRPDIASVRKSSARNRIQLRDALDVFYGDNRLYRAFSRTY